MLTAKDRPFCSFCHSLTGFTWHIRKRKLVAPDETDAEVKKDTDADVVDEDEKLRVVG